MSNAIEKIKTSLNQTFDCGIVMEVLNFDLTKKTLTVLVNTKDNWGKDLIQSLDEVNSKLSHVAQNDISAIGYKCTGFKLIKDFDDNVTLKKFIEWKAQHIPTNINQG